MTKEPQRLSDGSLPPQLPLWVLALMLILMLPLFVAFCFGLYWLARIGGLIYFLRDSIDGG